MAYLNALLLIGGALVALAGTVGTVGLGPGASTAGLLAMLAAGALIALTKRVADLEDRRDDDEERRNLEESTRAKDRRT